MKCFLLTAYPFGGGSYTWKTCGNNSSLKPRTEGGRTGVYWEVDGVDMFGGGYVQSGDISIVPWDTPSSTGNCNACQIPENEKYDCINGACTKATKYSTPGLYPSISDCEIACGTGCSGKCIPNSEWTRIEDLSNQLKNRNCS